MRGKVLIAEDNYSVALNDLLHPQEEEEEEEGKIEDTVVSWLCMDDDHNFRLGTSNQDIASGCRPHHVGSCKISSESGFNDSFGKLQ